MNSITFEEGTFGRRAVIHSAWSDRFADEIRRNGAVELELNEGKGWHGTDLSFLAELPHLMAFEIFNFGIVDISPIHSLHELRKLGITTLCSTAVDFSAFSRLESCDLEWRPRATSLFQRTALKHLFLNRYKGKDLSALAHLVNLQSLVILNAPIENLRGLSALAKLQTLRLGALTRLNSLAGIEGLVNLEELEVHTCRTIGSIDEIRSLSRLKRLHLNNDGKIDSLKPIAELTDLESVLFYESTDIVDGDLSPLLHLKKLKHVSFRNRRHYSHRREEFGDLYSANA